MDVINSPLLTPNSNSSDNNPYEFAMPPNFQDNGQMLNMNYPAFTGQNNVYYHTNDNYNDLNGYYNEYYGDYQSYDAHNNMQSENLQYNSGNINIPKKDSFSQRKRSDNYNNGTVQNNSNEFRNVYTENSNTHQFDYREQYDQNNYQGQYDQNNYYSSGQNQNRDRKSSLEENYNTYQEEVNLKNATKENLMHTYYKDPKKEPMKKTKDFMSLKQNKTDNKKTEICKWWTNGTCKFGEFCNYAHGRDEITNKNFIQKGANKKNLEIAPKRNKKSDNKRIQKTDFEKTETYKKLMDPDNFPAIDTDHNNKKNNNAAKNTRK